VSPRTFVGLLWLTGLMLWTPPSPAQSPSVFKCKGSDGSSYFSDRACPAGEEMAVKRELATSASLSLNLDRYMSARCLRLRDALRNSGEDGAKRQYFDEEYQQHCAAEEQEIRERFRQQAQDAYERSRQERRLVAEAKERRALEKSQCVELGSIIRAKREKLDSMTAGERLDYERSVSAFEQRCKGP
jgi:hypothetical protein